MKKTIFILLLVSYMFSVAAQQRIVLIEQFTNSGCPPCASSTPPVLQFAEDHPTDVVAIAYHTSFPYNDSMYHENPLQSAERVNYYGVSGVPYTIVDGNYYSSSSSAFIPVMADSVNSRKAISSSYNISEISNTIDNGILESSIFFSSLSGSNSTDSLHAMIVVIEKEVLKNSYAASPGGNSETSYQYVMRRILTENSGDPLKNRLAGQSDTFDLNWNLLHIKDVNQVRIVAFVQNVYTHEVYQAAIYSPVVVPSVKENEKEFSFNIFPNPASDKVFIKSNADHDAIIHITDLAGRLISSHALTNSNILEIETADLSKGMYILNYVSEGKKSSKKLLIQ
jgi:hypothetical protein